MDKDRSSELISRRDAFKRMLWGAAGIALAGRGVAFAQTAPGPAPAAAPAPKAKAVIQLWL